MSKKRLLTISDNQTPSDARCVVYVMMRDQRAADNHALLAAQDDAIERGLPLVVVFNVLGRSGVRSREQYQFMIDGLREVQLALEKLRIGFFLTTGLDSAGLADSICSLKPAQVFFDFNPLRGPRAMQKSLARRLDCPITVVDAHNIVPLWVTSDKEEYAAHTIRNKIHKHLEEWLVEPPALARHPHAPIETPEPDWTAAQALIKRIPSSGVVHEFSSGETAAHHVLADFIDNRLDMYAASRNVPTLDGQSNLSPYLHYGQLSAQRIAFEILTTCDQRPLLFDKGKLASYEGEPTRMDSVNAFLEELIIRRELADNYCFYQPEYDTINGAKDWARKTLDEHRGDEREYVYDRDQLAGAETHSRIWNACQMQLRQTGKLHGYLRMYWAKKILEWSDSPEVAIETAIYLNDHYSVDGGDPNGYVGIMWSIAGLHDRPWFDRAVFGKIRYMNQGGLARRFDVDEYAVKWLG